MFLSLQFGSRPVKVAYRHDYDTPRFLFWGDRRLYIRNAPLGAIPLRSAQGRGALLVPQGIQFGRTPPDAPCAFLRKLVIRRLERCKRESERPDSGILRVCRNSSSHHFLGGEICLRAARTRSVWLI